MPNSTEKRAVSKPAKPYPDFPLFAHQTRRWAKKIRGKLHYFGPWADAQGALDRYLEQRDDLHAGRTPRVQGDGVTVRDLANRFLTAKKHQLDTGEITHRTFDDYRSTCERVLDVFGKTRLVVDLRADDFLKLRTKIAKTRGVVALGNEVQRVRTLFKFAHDADLIERPVRFGPTFKRPSKKLLRKVRREKGPRMLERADLASMLDEAGVQMKAMILLGINCGFGNSDVAKLPLKALDLNGGWVEYPRPKTGVERRISLWPETVAVLKAVIASRPTPKDNANENSVFVTKYGGSWAKETGDNPISKETAKLLKRLGLHRPGLNFYALRHTFETIAGETRDQVAVDHIMGHARDDMASVYRERISDERLKAVTNFVREWLFGPWFSKSEILSLLESASTQLRAMILLGINCGLGEDDVAGVSLKEVDLEGGYVEHASSEAERRFPLWPETVEALKEVIASRPKPKAAQSRDLVFLTDTGKSWTKKTGGSAIGKEIALLLDNLEIQRPGLDFEALRRTFQEVAREHIADQESDTEDAAGTCLDQLSEEQLAAVAAQVRRWLFGEAGRRRSGLAQD